MPRLRKAAPLLQRRADTHVLRPKPKVADHVYRSAQYALWRSQVIARAGGRCQAVTDGKRCHRGEPEHRLFADHIHEIQDGGDPFDLVNGQALCGTHHTIKTARTRVDRLAR